MKCAMYIGMSESVRHQAFSPNCEVDKKSAIVQLKSSLSSSQKLLQPIPNPITIPPQTSSSGSFIVSLSLVNRIPSRMDILDWFTKTPFDPKPQIQYASS